MENDAAQPGLRRDQAPLQTSYSLEEAAAFLEVRADDLAAVLPSAGIDLSAREKGLLTRDDIERLKQLVHSIRQIPSQSMYGGGSI